MARLLKRSLPLLCSITTATSAFASPEVARGAAELVREAHAHEAAHEDDLALRRYNEALALDPTESGAYLGLGSLRLRMGDAREAARVFETALSHLPSLVQARLGRARAERALGARREADADMETYVDTSDDVVAIKELAGWYAEEGRPLAQLAAWRRLLGLAQRGTDIAATKDARLWVHALERIVSPADPVRDPPGERDASRVRRGMAQAEKRR